ncbi:MAG: hypothetical protein DMG02_33010 [Acidobacteria bacterium]|nr:MAG: hypothetical protein DMG02_33010 [Acidobacteriota bacterium]
MCQAANVRKSRCRNRSNLCEYFASRRRRRAFVADMPSDRTFDIHEHRGDRFRLLGKRQGVERFRISLVTPCGHRALLWHRDE